MKPLLLAFLLSLTACGNHRDDPAPAPPAPPLVVPVAKTHTVELSYWLASYGDASQLPATPPLIHVVLRPVRPGPGGAAAFQVEEPLLQLTDVSTAVKKVRLPDVTTYAPGPLPVLIASVTVPAVPGIGPGLGYYVQGHYTVDGRYDPLHAVFYDALLAARTEVFPYTAGPDWFSYTVEYKLKH